MAVPLTFVVVELLTFTSEVGIEVARGSSSVIDYQLSTLRQDMACDCKKRGDYTLGYFPSHHDIVDLYSKQVGFR